MKSFCYIHFNWPFSCSVFKWQTAVFFLLWNNCFLFLFFLILVFLKPHLIPTLKPQNRESFMSESRFLWRPTSSSFGQARTPQSPTPDSHAWLCPCYRPTSWHIHIFSEIWWWQWPRRRLTKRQIQRQRHRDTKTDTKTQGMLYYQKQGVQAFKILY